MNARVFKIFKLFQLFRGVDFAGPVWAVFLLERGFSLPEVGIIEAVLHVGMLAAQIPTGALADTLGRRRMLVAAGFFTAVSQLGWVYAPGLPGVCVAAFISGISFALVMGSDEAYLFDALAHDDAEAHFPRMLGGMWAVFQFAGAISFVLGGLIAESFSRPLAFWLTAGCALIASVLATRLPDDRRGHAAAHGLRVAAGAVRALRRWPRLAALTVAWSLLWAAITTWWLYLPALLQDRGADDSTLGWVMGGMMLVGAGFGWLGGHLPGRVSLTWSMGLSLGLCAVGIALTPAFGTLAVTAAVVLIISGLPDIAYAPLSNYLQHNTESEYRATSMSIAESGFSIQMLWMFPLAGLVIDRAGWETALMLDGLLLGLAAALVVASQWLPGRLDEPEPAVPAPAAT
ncbi:MAG TPA: MFS transporter [Gaiellales bacterium]|jgi:MFS family permease|nr:MFS transporter [Gaiellales bacterium]